METTALNRLYEQFDNSTAAHRTVAELDVVSGNNRLLELETARLLFQLEHELSRFGTRGENANWETSHSLAGNLHRSLDQFASTHLAEEFAQRRRALGNEINGLLEQAHQRIKERSSSALRLPYSNASAIDQALAQLFATLKARLTAYLTEILEACRERIGQDSPVHDGLGRAGRQAIAELSRLW